MQSTSDIGPINNSSTAYFYLTVKQMKERVLVSLVTTVGDSYSIILPHPRSGKSQAYLVSAQGDIHEVQRFKTFYSSWLIGSDFIADGGLYISSPVDVLLVLLPFLEKCRNKVAGGSEEGFFCDIDQILGCSDCCHLIHVRTTALEHLPCICDTKLAGGDIFYRLNDSKVLAWLLAKMQQVLEALGGVLGGMDEEGRLGYVVGFMSEYLSEYWSNKLSRHLKVDVLDACSVGQTRLASHVQDIISNTGSGAADKKQKVDLVKAAARKKADETKQANMAKIAQGTKNITNFFKPRS
ncbi:hypothetical protein CEUSTIGMA_g2939.t1 [Chlamydomonas eustigma]|uniref:Ribonuclease H2 subunit B n=1 Tax=Chlamydomonas eustigma TaxID=1157962 RepID=A0A250WXI5_9CHLO|nr:hypothetical protein CEUSTIGMA_g2939.t1 [Chlamydomonas eustigma]|eukprot:GAX75496.1 hypothetical protein CEUSTIGMA_g2939.t1 [Chlamydomonas eustigma]